MRKILTMAVMAVMVFSTAAMADAEWKLYGYTWFKYTMHNVGTSMDLSDGTYGSKFEIPRTYLRMKSTDKEAGYEIAVTLDINNTEDGQAEKIDWAVWAKYAYIDLTNLPLLKDIEAKLRVGLQKCYFGMADLWEYPIIDKSLDDKFKYTASADQGIAIVGRIPGGWGTYEGGIYNGNGYKYIESNVEKRLIGSLMLLPLPGVAVRGSVLRELENDYGDPAEVYTAWSGVIGLTSGPLSLWGQYVKSNETVSGVDEELDAMESFRIIAGVDVTKDINLQLGYDLHDSSLATAENSMQYFIMGAVYRLNSDVRLMLELQHAQDKEGGTGIEHDTKLMAQLEYGWSKNIK